MSDILETSRNFISALQERENRGVGHTSSALEFAKKIKAFFVVADHSHIKRISYEKTITVDQLAGEFYRGQHLPIVVDHYAYLSIISALGIELTRERKRFEEARLYFNKKTEEAEALIKKAIKELEARKRPKKKAKKKKKKKAKRKQRRNI